MLRQTSLVPYRLVHYPLERLLYLDYIEVKNLSFRKYALVDEKHNVMVNLGMRYFGERKKGTLTMAWTSGIRIGMAACHGGIKEIDFGSCADPGYITRLANAPSPSMDSPAPANPATQIPTTMPAHSLKVSPK